MLRENLVHTFTHVALSSDPDLAMPALLIARVEQPTLDVRPYLNQLDAIGREACRRVLGAKVPAGESSMWGDYHARELALYLLRQQSGRPYLKFW